MVSEHEKESYGNVTSICIGTNSTMDIFQAIESNREAGQTTLLIKVLKETPSAVLIVGSTAIKAMLVTEHSLDPKRVISITSLDQLRGRSAILLFDTTAFMGLQIKENKTRQVNVKIEEELYNKLEEVTEKESISAFVRKLIKKEVG